MVHHPIKHCSLAVFSLMLVSGLAYAQVTGLRPDQVTPATPDITWAPGGTGYQVGSTVPWRQDTTNAPTLTSADIAKVVELTFSGAITSTLPAATGVLGDGAGFTIQVGPGTLTLTPQSGSAINGQSSIKVGAYQSATLLSRGGKWYANLSVPQPPAQSGSTYLADNMAWATPAGGGSAPTGTCTASTNFFSRVWALPATLDGTVGGAAGPTNHLAAYDNLICGLVTDTVWASLDALWVVATAAATGSSTAVANLNLVQNKYTLVPSTGGNAPTFTANAGYTGGADNNTTVYIDTGFNPSTAAGIYVLGSAHISGWSLTNLQGTGGTLVGVYDGTNITSLVPWYTSPSNSYCTISANLSAGQGAWSSSTSLGSFVCNRNGTASSTQQLYHNGAVQTVGSPASAATTLINNNLYLLSRHDSGGPNSGAALQMASVSIGGSLTATLVSSSGTTTSGTGLVPRLCTYLTAVHGSC